MKHLLAILVTLLTTGCIVYYPASDEFLQEAHDSNKEYIIEEYEETKKTITPQDYAIVATRITNKMLDDTKNIYQKAPTPAIYINEITKESATLPDGFYYANKNIKDIIKNSNTYIPVRAQNNADYHLQTSVFEHTNPGTQAPIVLFNMKLIDKKGNIINEWAESITQPSNESSWW